MAFPEWSEALEVELRRAYQSAAPEAAEGGSRHTGLRAVYELLREKTAEEPMPRAIGDGPWNDRAAVEEFQKRYDASIPPNPWPYP